MAGRRHEVELPGIEPPEERRSRPAVRWHRAWRGGDTKWSCRESNPGPTIPQQGFYERSS